MRQEQTVIPIRWIFPLLFFGGGISGVVFYSCDSGLVTTAHETKVFGMSVALIMVGFFSLQSYALHADGISIRIAGATRRSILWSDVTEVRIVPDDISLCILIIQKGCPQPDQTKHQKYDFHYAWKNPGYILILRDAKRNTPIVEQYYPGEIIGKELLVEKKKN